MLFAFDIKEKKKRTSDIEDIMEVFVFWLIPRISFLPGDVTTCLEKERVTPNNTSTRDNFMEAWRKVICEQPRENAYKRSTSLPRNPSD